MSSTDTRFTGFTEYLASVPLDERRSILDRAELVAANATPDDEFDAPPMLWDAEGLAARNQRVRDLAAEIIDGTHYADHPERLADSDPNAVRAREWVVSTLRTKSPDALDQAEAVGVVTSIAMRQSRRSIGRTAAQILAEVPEDPDWLIPGIGAHGWTVKFAAREKTGKGTLITHLIGKLERGEASVFGPTPRKVRTLIYTEEPEDSMREKLAQSALAEAVVVYDHELAGLDWDAKVSTLVDHAVGQGCGLIFADNISRATGAEDEAGTELARMVEKLSTACKAAKLSLWIDHHHRKGAGRIEDKSRGGTALAGAVDNNVDLERVGDLLSRTLRVTSNGRRAATRWVRSIALSEDAREYVSVTAADDPQASAARKYLAAVRSFAPDGCTTEQVAEQMDVVPETARKNLKELETQGHVSGEGRPTRWTAVQLEDAEPVGDLGDGLEF